MVSEMDWIIHVLLFPLEVVANRGFTKLVTQWNGAVLGEPSPWAPAGMTKAFSATTFRWVSRIVSGNWKLSGGDNLEPLTADRHRRSAE